MNLEGTDEFLWLGNETYQNDMSAGQRPERGEKNDKDRNKEWSGALRLHIHEIG